MRKILPFLVCLAALSVWGQENFKGKDFFNQHEIIVQGGGESSRCQAVRIAPKWYLTAAHCVLPQCEKACDVVVHLLQEDVYASAVVHHKENTHERVFAQGNHIDDKLKNVGSDVALIFFDPSKSDYSFEMPSLNKKLGWSEFTKWLKQTGHNDYWESLEKRCAKLYEIPNAMDQHVLKPIAVPDIATDTWLSGTGFYYFNQLQHYIGPDIGVNHGMSGSGVVIPGGGIIGVVSSSLIRESSEQSGKAESVGDGYFFFAPINQVNRDFIWSVLSSAVSSPGRLPEILSASPQIAVPTDVRLEEVFGSFAVIKDEGLF